MYFLLKLHKYLMIPLLYRYMKMDTRTKEFRNIWTNPAILLDHSELEQSYEKFLEDSKQKYDPKRAALGVLRSQRNVVEFLRRAGLLEQALSAENVSSNPSSTLSDTSSLTNSVTSSSSGSSTPSSRRPKRCCTLRTTSTNAVLPDAEAVSQPKKS